MTSVSARHSSCARGLRPVANRRREPLLSNSKANLALYAHAMRLTRTDSEARLWRALRASQLGVAFRRQVPLLGFIADFYAPSVRLIIEIDGGYHERRTCADARRDRKLARAGYRTVRVSAQLVARDLAAVVAAIAAACRQADL
ncbi:MAG TPA: endonuclease domain-containing protein [Polyangiaceae bacterium]|nr:endonuclease domain-containing protein [Polyangiaceae bacterium]